MGQVQERSVDLRAAGLRALPHGMAILSGMGMLMHTLGTMHTERTAALSVAMTIALGSRVLC